MEALAEHGDVAVAGEPLEHLPLPLPHVALQENAGGRVPARGAVAVPSSGCQGSHFRLAQAACLAFRRRVDLDAVALRERCPVRLAGEMLDIPVAPVVSVAALGDDG